MEKPAAIFLAHLNPMTIAHEEIIAHLQKRYNVYVFPVRFLKDGKEINTKSFPFQYEVRKSMVEAVFGHTLEVLPHYTFSAPFIKYLPPLLSPYSWIIRNHVVDQIKEEKFVSYSGDKAERAALWAYGLNPIKSKRLEISSSAVKEILYSQVMKGGSNEDQQSLASDLSWIEMVPAKVVDLIKDYWGLVETFALSEDRTTRVMGMKFPKNGFF